MKYFLGILMVSTLLFTCTACSGGLKRLVDGSYESGGIRATEESSEPETVGEDEIAQYAYDCIDAAETLCKGGMNTVSAAWYFGIWDAPECEADTVIDRLAARMGFETSFVETNCTYAPSELINGDGNLTGWECCLVTAENCLYAQGIYTSIDEGLKTAKDLMRQLPEDYDNYQNLKNYYTQVAAYAARFEDMSGSYNDLTADITDYEDKIRSAKEPLLFDYD